MIIGNTIYACYVVLKSMKEKRIHVHIVHHSDGNEEERYPVSNEGQSKDASQSFGESEVFKRHQKEKDLVKNEED